MDFHSAGELEHQWLRYNPPKAKQVFILYIFELAANRTTKDNYNTPTNVKVSYF